MITLVKYALWTAPVFTVKEANGMDLQYILPIPKSISAKRNDDMCFANLDLSDVNLQVDVTKHSKELLAINTLVAVRPLALWSNNGTSHFSKAGSDSWSRRITGHNHRNRSNIGGQLEASNPHNHT
ncbi:unnamed protein product [Dicrocoelium dendriticum]|nr:unnamed protein product [Dicrocoelium dendriticum]